MNRILVTGSRAWPMVDRGVRELNEILEVHVARLYWRTPPQVRSDDFTPTIVVGDAAGVDSIAYDFAQAKRLKVEVHEALWGLDGKKAGVLRNIRMLDTLDPFTDQVVAFMIAGQANKGTGHCAGEAVRRGIRTHVHHYGGPR